MRKSGVEEWLVQAVMALYSGERTMVGQCLSQELKNVRHMSHQAQKGETCLTKLRHVSRSSNTCLTELKKVIKH